VDPHRLLGVAPGASADEVRRAFAGAVRAAHPDTAQRHAGRDTAQSHTVGGSAGRLAALMVARDELLRPGPAAVVHVYHRHALTSLSRWWRRRTRPVRCR
jgi:hypothetical protein